MSNKTYNYRQYVINNALELQKQNTSKASRSCCYWDACLNNNLNYINNHTYVNNAESIYTTEPSDLQLNYENQFKKNALQAKLNTHIV